MKKRTKGEIVLSVFLIALALLYIVPFVMMILGSFKSQAEASAFAVRMAVFELFTCIRKWEYIVWICQQPYYNCSGDDTFSVLWGSSRNCNIQKEYKGN